MTRCNFILASKTAQFENFTLLPYNTLMKKLSALILSSLILLSAFVFRNQIQAASYNYLYYSPCNNPIRYSIGEIDAEFNLTQQEVLKRSKTAESIWENASKKNLFEYDPKSPFTISVKYDKRQGLRSEANTLRGELESEQGNIDLRIARFNDKSNIFKNDVETLNADIAYWNTQGGAPEEEYKRLQERQDTLRTESIRLKKEAETLNATTDSFNSMVGTLNKTVETFNEALEARPEGGLYTQHGDSKNITVFFNNSVDEFVYTVTHEMGHAIGMDHVKDRNSLMYSQVTKVLIPSTYDLIELENACKKVSVFSPIITKLESLRFKF